MSDQLIIAAKLRSDLGKGASRRLRREAGEMPAVVYGAGKPAQSLTLVHKDLYKMLENEAVFSSVLTLDVEGKKSKVVLKALQRHPYKQIVLHADFLRINTKEALIMSVPLHFIGQDDCVGIRAGGAMTSHMNELEVKCLPADLPEFIEVNIADLNIGDAIHLSQIKLPKGVEMTHAIEDAAQDHVVVNVHEVKTIVEEEAPVESAEEASADAE